MNRFIIDTHIFLWLIFDPDKIEKSKLDILKKPKNKIYVTSITFWEISLKYSLGKLELDGFTPDELPLLADKMGIDTMQIDIDTFASFYKLPKDDSHKDPFDRIIIWKCIDEKISLISKDRKFPEYEKYDLKVV
ncbi:MAG: type II toxin-antitoxin system VapC family toxin [Campylobacterales bacterium]|nr:type II toxin-antitoxin system VapC family toxin [Campylobacterales bacterium]